MKSISFAMRMKETQALSWIAVSWRVILTWFWRGC